MSFHLIVPMEATEWRMSPVEFSAKLTDFWPNASVESGKIPGIALNWSIPIEDYEVRGTFHDNGLVIGLNGFFEGYAIFACWYRTLVPLDIPLVLIDEGFNTMYPLGAETAPDDIISGRIATEPPLGKP